MSQEHSKSRTFGRIGGHTGGRRRQDQRAHGVGELTLLRRPTPTSGSTVLVLSHDARRPSQDRESDVNLCARLAGPDCLT